MPEHLQSRSVTLGSSDHHCWQHVLVPSFLKSSLSQRSSMSPLQLSVLSYFMGSSKIVTELLLQGLLC